MFDDLVGEIPLQRIVVGQIGGGIAEVAQCPPDASHFVADQQPLLPLPVVIGGVGAN